MRRSLPTVALIGATLAAWELAVVLSGVPGYIFPTPAGVAGSLHSDAGLLARASEVTLEEVVLGYLLALAVGIAIAVIVASSVHVRRAALPLLVISQTIPMVLLAPILAILLGYGLEPKLLIVAIVCFFPVVVNAVDGFDAADPELVRMMRTLNAGGVAIFRRVIFPGALPSIFAGARIAATYAAIGAVFGEWAGSSAGLGFVILQAEPALQTARIFAAVIVLSAIALALYGLVSLAERLFIPWTRQPTHH